MTHIKVPTLHLQTKKRACLCLFMVHASLSIISNSLLEPPLSLPCSPLPTNKRVVDHCER